MSYNISPSLTYFTQYDTLYVHPCCCKWYYFIAFNGWVIFHCIYVPHLLCPFLCQWTFRLLPCPKRLTDLEDKLMVARGRRLAFGMDMYTLLCLKWITNKDLLYSTWNSVQHYVAAWMGGEFGGEMDTCICMAVSLCCSPEIITLLISYTPVQYKKSKLGKIKP